MFSYHVLVFCSVLLTVCFFISGCLFMSCVKIKSLWLFMYFYHHVSVLCCQQLSAGPCFCRCCWPRLCCSISRSLLLYCVADRDYVFSISRSFFLCSVTSWRSLFRYTRFFSSSWHSFLSMGSSLFNLSKSDWAILQWMHSVECVYTLMYPSCTNLT